jgi:biotin/methionine sulfoxide reductase
MHPRDAAARNIYNGELVRVFNDRGACLAGATLDERLREGVVMMATGAWYTPDESGLEIAGNPNVLSCDVGTSRLTQGPSALSVLVEVERYRGAAPPAADHAGPGMTGGESIL